MAKITRGAILVNTYEIVDIIGSGGGGITYKARHLRLQTDVVVKKIKEEVLGKVNIRAEADILKNLKHAYLPRVYDFIEADDGVYTVIDYIPGDNLEDAVKKHGPFDQKLVLKWANQLAEALDYLHSQNPPIIHSDIKPANIMLTKDGDICLIDFNISLALGESMESAVGVSPGFSPPEQFKSVDSYVNLVVSRTGSCSLSGSFAGSNSVRARSTVNRPVTNQVYEKTEILSEDESGNAAANLHNKSDADGTVNLFAGSNSNSSNAESPVPKSVASVPRYEALTNLNRGTTLSPNDVQTEYTNQIGRGIDSRSDIYSLGMTLVYLLTGIKSSLDYDERVTLDDTRVYVPEGFGAIIRKMINYDPDYRYKDGTVLLNALRNIHKLDGRYKSVKRVQTILQLISLVLFVAGIGMVTYGFLSINNEKNGQYNKYIDKAEKYIEEGEYEDAEDMIDAALRMDSERGDAYRERIYLLYCLGEYEDAIDEGVEYVNSPTLKAWLKGKAENTLKSKEQSVGDIYYIIGNSYYELGEYSRAAEYIEEAIEYNNTNGLYYRDYAIALAKIGKTEEAEEQLDIAEDLDLADDSIYLVKGQIAYLDGEYDDAVEYFERSMSHAESEQILKRALFMCSDAYNAMGPEYADDNIDMLNEYKDSFGAMGGLMVKEYLANAYLIKAEEDPAYNEMALEVFLEIVDDGYSSFRVMENIAVIYGNIGEYEKAFSVLMELADQYPGNYNVYKDLAFMEIYSQKEKENQDRDYHMFKTYFDQAKSLCDQPDDQMEMLERTVQELIAGGWELD